MIRRNYKQKRRRAYAIHAAGGLLYGLIEILWRGWTHWSMVLCGGLCFLVMYLISGLPLCLMKKCVLSSAAICTAEFYTGCLVNLRLGWNVWDYSAERLNLLGQICPRFALLWLLLSVPGLWLCSRIRRVLSQ